MPSRKKLRTKKPCWSKKKANAALVFRSLTVLTSHDIFICRKAQGKCLSWPREEHPRSQDTVSPEPGLQFKVHFIKAHNTFCIPRQIYAGPFFTSLRPQKEDMGSEVWNETKQEHPEWGLGDPKRSTEKPCDSWMQSVLTASCPGWSEVILTGRELARWLWVFIKLYDLSCPDCLWLEHTKVSPNSKKHHVLVETYSRSGFWNQRRSSPGQKANVGSGPCWENLQCRLDSWVDQYKFVFTSYGISSDPGGVSITMGSAFRNQLTWDSSLIPKSEGNPECHW